MLILNSTNGQTTSETAELLELQIGMFHFRHWKVSIKMGVLFFWQSA